MEIIYIDDGSNDESMKVFEDSVLPFSKKSYQFSKNQGRVFARNKGIEISSGDWLLFLSSNIKVNNMLLVEYSAILKKYSELAFMGSVEYISSDLLFERYLNHHKRGINRLNNESLSPFKFLLFSNCLIHKSIFKKIKFNTEFTNYGGEELEFSYHFNQLYPQNIRVCKKAKAIRMHHPGLWKHCDRMYAFGTTNFILLNEHLKKDIIKYTFLLTQSWLLIIMRVVEKILKYLYRWKITSYYMIRFIMLCALLRGYFTAQKFQNHQIQDLQ